ncbi:MAG TPA: glycosyltransferase [Thermoanaerobaculaceae bacterium]|nr:glycosyltransferase [Thermoanaerobaculaceae bacterium]
MLPHLARTADVALLQPPDWQPPERAGWLDGLCRLAWDAATPQGAIALLHLGNNPYHLWIARRLRRHGGVVVLHDSVLHHLLVEEAAEDGDWQRFGAEMTEAHGPAGAALAAARRWGYAARTDPFLFPARAVYLKRASAVLVHNHRAAADVVAACPGMPVRQVPLAVASLPKGNRRDWRRRLGAGDDDLVVAHLGFLTPAKGLDTVLRALVALGELNLSARLVVVGEGEEGASFVRTLRSAGLEDRVTVWGWADRADLGGILHAADVGLVPRYPTAGETSAAALRFLASGTPVAISGFGQFLELPADAAPRIEPGRAGVADLVRLMALLAVDREARRRSRAAARRAWERGEHDPERAASRLLTVLEELDSDVV